jgi:ABC-2 type transport system ATP-binding protein
MYIFRNHYFSLTIPASRGTLHMMWRWVLPIARAALGSVFADILTLRTEYRQRFPVVFIGIGLFFWGMFTLGLRVVGRRARHGTYWSCCSQKRGDILLSILTLEGVSKKIGKRWIVEDLHMTVKAGEVYGFLGPNGAGKTTTIRMIVGLARPTRGQIRVLGHDVWQDRRAALAKVGAIVENPEVYSYLTGRQNLLHYARLAGIDDARRRIEEVGERVGLRDRLDDKVKRYSLGMRQRLGVAQALLAQPKLLVLDEPTNGLDPAGIREFREMMRVLAADGMSVFISSHLLTEIQMMCDRVAILKAGRVIAERSVADLTAASSNCVAVQVGDTEAAMTALQAGGWSLETVEERRLRVNAKAADVPTVVRTLVTAGIDVYAVEPERESLEEAFLELTDDKMGESRPLTAAGGGPVHA